MNKSGNGSVDKNLFIIVLSFRRGRREFSSSAALAVRKT